MKHTLSGLFGAVLLCTGSLSSAADIDVMTQNQYLGADLAPVLAAATTTPFDAAAFNDAIVAALRRIAATRPAERALALAAEIAQRKPDVVGLQEAYRFACLPYPGVPVLPGTGCDDPGIKGAFSDQLANTLAALRGKYALAAKVTNLQVAAIPFSVNGFPALLSLEDRDAILVRKELTAQPVSFAATPWLCSKPSADGCNYVTAPPAFEIRDPGDPTTVLLTIAVERGFVGVDVTVRGQGYRVFNTHLEQRLLGEGLLETRVLQVGQAYELLSAAQGTWDPARKLIVVGDLNSAPGDTIPVPPYPPVLPSPPFPDGLPMLPPYQVFTQIGGFTDAWMLRPQTRDAGYSCCQKEDLTNRHSKLDERIDMIFSLTQPSRVLDMKLLGNTMGDKTRPPGIDGLWPSDHASVAATLKFD